MKKIIFAVMTAAAMVAVAQGLQPRRSGLLRNRNGNAASSSRQSSRHNAAPPPAADVSVDELADGSALNFNQTALELVFEAYGRMVGKTILKDPQCPNATITLKSEKGQKLTQEEQVEAIEVVLEMNGVHLEPYGDKFVRALPRKDARKEGIPLLMDADAQIKESGKVISMMLPFKNISMEDARQILDQFRSATGMLIAIERTNSILITDTEMNINRMREIAKTIDVATPVLENVFVRQVKNANATEIKTALEAIVQESQKELEKSKGANSNVAQPSGNVPRSGLLGGLRRPGQNNNNQQQAPAANSSLVISDADRGMIRGKVLILADERSNKLIIVTQRANMDFFDRVIEQLDVETTPDTVVKVYRLKYADAEDVSDMINDLIGNSVSSKNGSKNNQNQNSKKGTSGNITRNSTPQPAAKKPANQRTGDAQAGELSKENTTVLADKRINGLVVMTMKELVPTIEQIIESMDIKLSQVLIETCIIEVSLDDGLETGVDWVRNGRQKTQTQATDANGNKLYYAKRTTTTKTTYSDGSTSSSESSSALPSIVGANYTASSSGTKYYDKSGNEVEEGSESIFKTVTTSISDAADTAGSIFPMVTSLVKNNLVNGSDAYASMMGGGGGSSTGTAALNELISEGVANPIGGGLNYFFTSDALNLSAVIQASKTDSRTKYIASPIIMTLDNKEAVINATKMRYLLKGFTSSGNSYSTIAVPDYEQKELGIEIKVTPKINPNGTVMLTMEEKYSQVAGSQDIKYATGNTTKTTSDTVTEALTGETSSSALETVNVDTTATREMSSDVLLENGQTVIFGGLTETLTVESETGIPILKDIPIIGKWLFGSVSESETRSELLVFMTPYVLDDSEAAQAEAIRRKKAMSDPRPWDDHGWSASNLADPVAKQEQLRRIKDEWKKQDEERKTRIAIEKEKIERAKKLKTMSQDERELWLKMHKDELEKEQQEELEKKMQDKESQEELKKLAAEIRAKKLGAAEAELKKAEEETTADNERAKIDAAKKEKEREKREGGEKSGESDESGESDKSGERGERPVSRDPVAPDVAEPQVSLASLAPQVKPEGGEKGDAKAEKETR